MTRIPNKHRIYERPMDSLERSLIAASLQHMAAGFGDNARALRTGDYRSIGGRALEDAEEMNAHAVNYEQKASRALELSHVILASKDIVIKMEGE